MAYCEDCGLSSCYERGGHCRLMMLRMREHVAHLKPHTVKWLSGEWTHVRSAAQTYPEQHEWIEVAW